ncbi:phosphoenolpyruvate--protein phosphotransferase [Streptomyces diastaticus]|uniref:Phosphoenolpyruvate-protein phosphotransferase n=2 Tax=Streptomyces diastaticus TaxID=1956 RepID=A0ABQ1CSS9_STRDI|nr:phosphoenolpyruvate--protein phosphotransferase [Streptomyces diastaticus]GFH73204.1 phosphoenolpyruvate-protein phosphotransferase [Streptomyces diastaticus subsp. diastaticus]GGU46923.1 phosphoenolpyruvate-protein phosphotransferase [Streptomyces diastaticus subsp. diastaticus]
MTPAPLTGIGVGGGTAWGPVARMAPPPALPAPREVAAAESPAEAAAARAALTAVADDLARRAAAADGEAADVLTALGMMAADPALVDSAEAKVCEGRDAPHALAEAFAGFAATLRAAGGYFAERVADLDDLRDRAVAHALGLPMPGLPDPGHPYVLVAADLSPADTALLDPARVRALVTEEGGPTSHTAILAKILGLPAVVACEGAALLTDGSPVLVDGGAGTVLTDPSPEQVAGAAAEEERRRRTAAASSGPGRTADGHPVRLMVNLGAPHELAAAAEADSEGVGLFRTEFLYLDRATAPGAEEQRETYRRVFDAFAGRRVVVRTLDAGADKPLPFATAADEPNPALGVRGLRTAVRHPELLDTQLAAVAHAARTTGAEVWVMAPMVSVPAEARAFAEQARSHGLRTAGAMVEVPAAALRAGQLAEGCDFLSIGTNDLAQYAFAADRMLGSLAALLDPWQPALLELVRQSAEAGTAHGRPVGVCGEAASDPLLALVLVGLGVTSLSAAPGCLAGVRGSLASRTLAECRELAGLALAAPDAAGARRAVTAAARPAA